MKYKKQDIELMTHVVLDNLEELGLVTVSKHLYCAGYKPSHHAPKGYVTCGVRISEAKPSGFDEVKAITLGPITYHMDEDARHAIGLSLYHTTECFGVKDGGAHGQDA